VKAKGNSAPMPPETTPSVGRIVGEQVDGAGPILNASSQIGFCIRRETLPRGNYRGRRGEWSLAVADLERIISEVLRRQREVS